MLILITSFVFGICFGSFLTTISYRLPLVLKASWTKSCHHYLNLKDPNLIEEETSINPFRLTGIRSYCTYCHHKIPFYYNIPLLSYVLLRGECKFCHHRISINYPILELLSGIIVLLIVFNFGLNIKAIFATIFCLSLLALAAIDIKEQLLPDCITLPLLWLGLIINNFSIFTSLHSAIWGAVIGYGLLWGIYNLYKITRKVEALGFGDLKCLAAIGAWLGVNALLPVLLIASTTALVIFYTLKLMLIKSDKENNTLEKIAFGPYLAFASIIIILCHNSFLMNSTYMTLLI
ncbi:A24 family peptidase [Thiotrichales bacterium 19S9-12]|nr:A24 family peptidase [Thiotrichales bacterium 19S9-11]MCF6810821.1 A24 family peptidase [Thiotrichales bacterium 19S9-12]